MEIFVIALCMGLIFRAQIESALRNNWAEITSNAKPLIQYLGASMILTTTIGIMPSLMLTIYMRMKGFFAFEIFASDSHAFGVLYGNIFVNYLVLSFGFFGSTILIAKKATKGPVIALGIVNGLLCTYIVSFAYESSEWAAFGRMFLVTAGITAYTYFWITSGISGKARGWFVPLGTAAALLFLPIVFPEPAAGLVQTSLAQMKVGGMKVKLTTPADLFKSANERKYTPMWLILRTPEFLYLSETRKNKNVLVLKSSEYVVTTDVPEQD